jgi:hypothetical protein
MLDQIDDAAADVIFVIVKPAVFQIDRQRAIVP